MIYVSTSCLKEVQVCNAIEALAKEGILNIELSGGHEHCSDLEGKLLDLQKRYSLNYLLHNYFPHPDEDFVINLASMDRESFNKSVTHIKKALALSKTLNCKKFGFHSGFYFDLQVHELGNKVEQRKMSDKEECLEQFCDGVCYLHTCADQVDLYLENNVVSKESINAFNGENPFMLTSSREYRELRAIMPFKLLLDVGHLKVSCNTLKLDFEHELSGLMPCSDYIHISENNGLSDQHELLKRDSGLMTTLQNHSFENKTVTVEMHGDMRSIKCVHSMLQELIS